MFVKTECSIHCAHGDACFCTTTSGEESNAESDDREEMTQEDYFRRLDRRRRFARRYDGSRCFCRPCPECHAQWIPRDCHWSTVCTDCQGHEFQIDAELGFHQSNLPDSFSEIHAFRSRIASARAQYYWEKVRKVVKVRPYVIHWLQHCTEACYHPSRIDMAQECKKALDF